jgi:hypothetical protein
MTRLALLDGGEMVAKEYQLGWNCPSDDVVIVTDVQRCTTKF